MAADSEQSRLTHFGRGLGRFLDRFLCGRDNHQLMYSCLGLGALEAGLPQEGVPYSLPLALINNRSFPLELANPTVNPFQAMGMDHPPIYTSIGDTLHLPDFNYNDAAHVLCITNGVYDTGKRFYELWEDPELHHNVLSVLTDKQFIGTGLPHAVSIAVMTLLHPLGALIAIPMGHFCGQLVGSLLRMMLGEDVNVSMADHGSGAQQVLSHAMHGDSSPKSNPDKQSLRIEVLEPKQLKPYQSNSLTLKLMHADGTPVPAEHLMDMHGAKMHAFIINATLSDGHHLHPVATAEPGIFRANFTPAALEPYRIFVDCQHQGKPQSTMIHADISPEMKAKALPSRIIQSKGAETASQKGTRAPHLYPA